jgi:hypothetical protein
VRAQRVDVRLVDSSRRVRELDREVAERPFPRGELGLPVVVYRVSRQLLVCALGTEVVGVRAGSVVTAQLGGGDRRKQLALPP